MKNTTIKIILDNKRLSNGKYGIYLRVIKDRKRKLISLGLKCGKDEFSNEVFNKNRPNYKSENELLLQLKNKANFIIREFRLDDYDFTLNEFENKFKGKSSLKTNVISFFDEIITELEKSKRMGTARAYKDTKNSLIKYSGTKMMFQEINLTYIEKYEAYLRGNNNNDGGVSFKMRDLRAIFNKAINRGLVTPDKYPFKNYKMPKSRAKKRALTIEEFKKIRDLNLSKYPHLIEAHNYFLFSFYVAGINFVDMLHLKWSNIENNRIIYKRAKTKTIFSVNINKHVQVILDYYKSQNRPTEYVFPILLKENLTSQQIFNRKHKVLQRFNKKLKEIAKIVGIDKPVTSYYARHSFATILKLTGTETNIISELMGHSNTQITETYLKSFNNETLDKANNTLLDL